MKNNKGFISMSLVYSFLIVFVTISAALLTVYTENISDVRKLNTEIKDDLIERGNDQIIVLTNLVYDGSFEATGTGVVTDHWQVTGNRCNFSSKNVQSSESGYVQTGQSYYGDGSIEVFTDPGTGYNTDCRFASTHTMKLYKNHVYYVEITYNSGNGYPAGGTHLYFINNYNNDPTSTNMIATTSTPSLSSAKPFMTPWTMPSGSGATFTMGSVNADIFRFTKADGDYYIGLKFTGRDTQPTYMDGFMLIDITAAIGVKEASKLCSNAEYALDSTTAPENCVNTATYAPQIWRLKSGKVKTTSGTIQYTTDGFYDDRKVFSAHDENSIK